MIIPETNKTVSANRRNFGKAMIASFLGTFLPQSSVWATSGNILPGKNNDDYKRIKELLTDKEPKIWVFTGDSITHGVKHTHGERSYPEIFQERIRYEMGKYRDVVINTGISGHTTDHLLKDFEWRIAHFKPAVVSIMIGTNDCAKEKVSRADYRQNLLTLASKIRAEGTVPIFHTPNSIILEKASERQTLPDYVKIMQELASQENIILVDNYKLWQETDIQLVHKEWLNDPLHPNGKGHVQIAREMFRTLDIFDPAYPTCGAPYYEGEH